jgi:hypothetical protein
MKNQTAAFLGLALVCMLAVEQVHSVTLKQKLITQHNLA